MNFRNFLDHPPLHLPPPIFAPLSLISPFFSFFPSVQVVEHEGIVQHGTCFAKDVWDPAAVDPSDYYEAICESRGWYLCDSAIHVVAMRLGMSGIQLPWILLTIMRPYVSGLPPHTLPCDPRQQ